MRKVCFIHPSSELYGADKILVNVMKNYPDFHKVLILKFDGPLISLVKKEIPDVEIFVIPSLPILAKKFLKPNEILSFIWSSFTFRFKLKKIFKNNFDIVYLNTLAVLPLLFYFSSNVKKVVHVHEILKNENILNRIINILAVKYSDFLICVSKAVKENLEYAYRTKKNKLILINNGISFKTNNNDITLKNFDKNKINFALIGRIKPSHKGQILLIDAISKLDKSYLESAHFFMVGSTVIGQEYMLDDVKKLIDFHKLNDFITIVPFVENISAVYKKIDVVIVPSVFDDPFPTTVLEAMFFSIPVIGTNVGGIPEMIQNYKTGIISKKDCPIDLSINIKFFMDNQQKIAEYGKNGFERFSIYFSKKSFDIRYSKMINEYLINE